MYIRGLPPGVVRHVGDMVEIFVGVTSYIIFVGACSVWYGAVGSTRLASIPPLKHFRRGCTSSYFCGSYRCLKLGMDMVDYGALAAKALDRG